VTGKHVRRRAAAWSVGLTLLVAFVFGSVVRVSLANHYHSHCVGHGFVHGVNAYDGSFATQTETGCADYDRYCMFSSTSYPNGFYVQRQNNYSTTCYIHSSQVWQSATECLWYSENRSVDSFGWHDHYPDTWAGCH
jgi:hypothetical protein